MRMRIRMQVRISNSTEVLLFLFLVYLYVLENIFIQPFQCFLDSIWSLRERDEVDIDRFRERAMKDLDLGQTSNLRSTKSSQG